jgi:hypothetical protein
MTGLATVANMGAEVGATTSTFPYSENMRAYLNATGRAPVALAADKAASMGYLSADEGAEYDEVIEIVRPHNLFNELDCLIHRYRTCPRLSQLLTALSLPTWQHLCRSLDPL